MNLLHQETIMDLFRTYYPFFVLCLFMATFVVTYYIIPKVIWVSNEKNLMAPVNNRSSHSVETPSFGGVAFYVTIILVLTIIQSLDLTYAGNHLIAAITILFMVGLKDDLVVSTARVKLFGQIAAACFIIFSPELHVTDLHGFLGINEIPYRVGYLINAVIIIAIINAYNLIDGIDGLAAMVGIVISMVFAYVFYISEHPFYVLVSTSMVGILSAFLRFNFSRTKKIFMGDSGSLVIGLVLAFLSVKLLAMEPYAPFVSAGFDPADRVYFIACILFIPIFDTMRVMLIRIMKGESPFSADKNHAHHVLLNLGFSHFKASACMALVNGTVVVIYLYFAPVLSHVWLGFLVVFIYASAFFILNRLRIMGAQEATPAHIDPFDIEREFPEETELLSSRSSHSTKKEYIS